MKKPILVGVISILTLLVIVAVTYAFQTKQLRRFCNDVSVGMTEKEFFDLGIAYRIPAFWPEDNPDGSQRLWSAKWFSKCIVNVREGRLVSKTYQWFGNRSVVAMMEGDRQP